MGVMRVDDTLLEYQMERTGIFAFLRNLEKEGPEEKPLSKKRRPNEVSIDIFECSIGDTLNLDDFLETPIRLQYHVVNDSAFIIVVADVVPLFKCNVTKCSDKLKCALQIVAQKCSEWEIKQSNMRLRVQSSAKKRKKRLATAATPARIQYKYKEIDCSPLSLRVNSAGGWLLFFDLKLNYSPQSVNNFSHETSTFLDILFSANRTPFMKHEILHSYIQKQFNHQTRNFSRKRLSGPTNLESKSELTVQLLPFQEQSVHWMLEKEGFFDTIESENVKSESQLCEFLNINVSFGYETMMLVDGSTMFWNKFTGYILSLDEAWDLYHQWRSDETRAKGVLSEEMGLGKTIEILALLLLNKRKVLPAKSTMYNSGNKKEILKVKTNLVICPDSILQQWIDEIQNHVRDNCITIFHYQGFLEVKKHFNTDDIGTIVDKLSSYDLVICSYTTVSSEVHYAEFSASTRPRRGMLPKYDYSSPLSLMQFFRIILDEVQMLRGESTNAARCTNLLHRVHTWGVSGTPIYSITDFKTVLSYLQVHPFQDFPKIVDIVRQNTTKLAKLHRQRDTPRHKFDKFRMVNGVRFEIGDLFEVFTRFDLCIRHSKHDVASQVEIPKQHNYIVPLDFPPIEQDNYINLWSSFLEASGFTSEGQGRTYLGTNELNYWLNLLRKTCCHALMPKASAGRLENEDDSTTLQTMDDILNSMTSEVYDKIDVLYRENFTLRIQSGQVKMEIENDPRGAIEVFMAVKDQLLTDLKEKFGVLDPFSIKNEPFIGKKEIDADFGKKVKEKLYLDLLHQCFFFIGTAYYFLGSKILEKVDDENEKLKLQGLEHECKIYTQLYSFDEMKKIENYQKLEQDYYNLAENLRKEILSDRIERVDLEILDVKNILESGSPDMDCFLEEINFDDTTDYSSNVNVSKCFKRLCFIFQGLNYQAQQYNNLVKQLQELSFKSIIQEYDEDNQNEKALDYENSVNDQDKTFAILDCLERILANRDDLATADEEIKLSTNLFKNVQAFSDYHIELISELKLLDGMPLKTIFDDLKNVSIVKSLSANTPNTKKDFEGYLLGYEKEALRIKSENKKLRDSLKKFSGIYNAKTAYFSYLQKISDSLVSLIQLEPAAKSHILRNTKGNLQYHENMKKINGLHSRIKYLETLTKLNDAMHRKKKFTCTICFSEIYMGSIIKCGHFFCKSCIHSWLRNKNACPLCKMETNITEVYSFKLQDEDRKTEDISKESSMGENGPKHSVDKTKLGSATDAVYLYKYQIYPHLDKINQLTIKESYGTKIDFVVKLILYLKIQHGETTTHENLGPLQIVIYSQYLDFLEILSKVLTHHSIKHFNTTKHSKFSKFVEKFKKSPDITCLLLNVRKQASGLTLVNATHVFLLDPIINHGDELQAINRVHRIGQTRETCVWNFVVKNTVEENILKYKCVLEEKKANKNRNKNKNPVKGELEGDHWGTGDSDSSENESEDEYDMNDAGDESVSDKHIWSCFFQKYDD